MAAAACEAVRVKRSIYDADPEADEFSLAKRCRPLLPVTGNKGPLHHRIRTKLNYMKSPFAGAAGTGSGYTDGGASCSDAASSGMDVEKFFVGAKRRRKGRRETDEGGPAKASLHPLDQHHHASHAAASAAASSPEAMAADSPRKEEPILFTLAQVKAILQSALEEKEAELVAKYDAILAERLTDQFNMFSKFNQDYIHSTFSKDRECSYMS
eukprot:m.170281 g.170281  ORF g.170281 m.170281 type:complete len:212 (-) comp13221_c0_seq1:411-1046(-)